MVVLSCLTSVDMRFDSCSGDDGPAEEGHDDSLPVVKDCNC